MQTCMDSVMETVASAIGMLFPFGRSVATGASVQQVVLRLKLLGSNLEDVVHVEVGGASNFQLLESETSISGPFILRSYGLCISVICQNGSLRVTFGRGWLLDLVRSIFLCSVRLELFGSIQRSINLRTQ